MTGRGRGMRYDSIVVVVLSSQFCMKRPDLLSGLSFWCVRPGALTCWLKSNAGPARGTASRTARGSIVRWNPKEAAGKTLVRRRETTYEAHRMGEEAMIFKVQCLHGSCGSKCGGHKRGGQCALSGEVSGFAIKLGISDFVSIRPPSFIKLTHY